MTLIELRDLRKSYPRQAAPAVAGVSLRVEPQTLLALLGPSGSGKSTVLKLVAGIEEPDRGEILLDGRDVGRVPAHRRGAVLMFQKAYLFPFLSVADNVAFGLRARGVRRAEARAEVAAMLELVGLPGFEGRRPTQLSGGEQQRVALARALVVRPRVLLLDEPFSGLDPAVRRTLQGAVRRLQRELGITAVLVTHDRAEALAMADSVALIERGALLAHGPPRQLYERPPTRRAARQMGVETFLRGELSGDSFHGPLGRLALAEAPAGTGRATLAIRPEHLRLLPGPAPNAVAAELLAETFRGDHLEYELRARGVALRARASQPWAGGALYVQLPPEHLFRVDDDEPDNERQP